MSLVNLRTNFKDLKYGHDREGGGSSNQPYIKTPINVNLPPAFNFLGSDFILRGGPIGAPLATVNDVVRLTKYFADIKTPSGLLFIAKQNLLSRTAVRTQASGKLVNEDVYTPLSTLAQAGVSAFGLHLNKQGLNPIPGGLRSLRTYSDVVTGNSSAIAGAISNLSAGAASLTGIAGNLLGGAANPLSSLSNNRLVALYGVKIDNSKASYLTNGLISVRGDNVNLISYQGGPGSFLGIGLTNIQFADQRTGANNPNYGKNSNYLDGLNNSLTNREDEAYISQIQNPIGVSAIYKNLIPSSFTNLETKITSLKTSPFSGSSINQYAAGLGPQNVYSFANNKFGTATTLESIGGAYVFTQNELINEKPYQNNIITKLKDFRATIRNRIKEDTIAEGAASIILSNSPDYSKYNIENRINLGDPGNKFSKNIASYTLGWNGGGNASPDSYDKMALVPLYTSENADTTIKDLVNFRIAAISNDDPTQKTYIHFRAFLGSISDSYTGKWNSSRYVGRGEDFYTYDGFSRKISLSFTIAAQSKIELIPLYEKLNYLISNMAPDYSKVGYMRGPLVTLTIGGYILEMPGFIEGMSIEIGEETSWEIGIDDAGEPDTSVKQLAHVIKVSGFSFTPIHRFAPRKANVNNLSATKYILNELPPDPPPPSPTPEPVIPDPPPLPDPKPKPKPVLPPPLQAVTTYQSDKATPPPNMGKSTSTPGSGNNITGNTAGQGPQLVLDPKTGKLVIK
jgi:hypothetical protein